LNKKKEGKIFVISAPSGTGKSTLADMLLKSCSLLHKSISYTTRSPRPGEVNGKDYYFITVADFKKKIKEGFFAEWAEVYGDYYGTSYDFLARMLKEGRYVILVIDTQGAFQIKKRYPENTVLIFIAPPSFSELKKRLINRGTENEQRILKRLEKAKKEMKEGKQYDIVIINDSLEKAFRELRQRIMQYLS